MFNFTKKAEIIEEQIELTDEQLTEVTGGGLVTGLIGLPQAAATTSTGTDVQVGLQTAAGVGIKTDALNAVTGLI